MSEGSQENTTMSPVSLHDDDSSDDGLWGEFENCATSVTHLYRNSNWRTLQSAAASTTQLYKHGLETKKRSFDRGFVKGRTALAREISTLCRYKNKVDVADIVAMLSKYDLLTSTNELHQRRTGGNSPRQQRERDVTGVAQMDNGNAGTLVNPNAVFLFQEALAVSGASPTTQPQQRNNSGGGLGIFLQNQVYRHRKRPHSPAAAATYCQNTGSGGTGGGGSPAHHAFEFVSKRFKRL